MAKSTQSGTTNSTIIIGRPEDVISKYIYANVSSNDKPGLRYYVDDSKWQFSNDGVTWTDFSSKSSSFIREEYAAVAGNQSVLDGYYAQIGGTQFDPSLYTETELYDFKFEVIIEAPSGGDMYIDLYNQIDGYQVIGSELSTSEVIPTFVSTSLTPGDGYFSSSDCTYIVRGYSTLDGYAGICKMARICVYPAAPIPGPPVPL